MLVAGSVDWLHHEGVDWAQVVVELAVAGSVRDWSTAAVVSGAASHLSVMRKAGWVAGIAAVPVESVASVYGGSNSVGVVWSVRRQVIVDSQ